MNIDEQGEEQQPNSRSQRIWEYIKDAKEYLETWAAPLDFAQNLYDLTTACMVNPTPGCYCCLCLAITATVSVASLAIGLGIGVGVGCTRVNIVYTNATNG